MHPGLGPDSQQILEAVTRVLRGRECVVGVVESRQGRGGGDLDKESPRAARITRTPPILSPAQVLPTFRGVSRTGRLGSDRPCGPGAGDAASRSPRPSPPPPSAAAATCRPKPARPWRRSRPGSATKWAPWRWACESCWPGGRLPDGASPPHGAHGLAARLAHLAAGARGRRPALGAVGARLPVRRAAGTHQPAAFSARGAGALRGHPVASGSSWTGFLPPQSHGTLRTHLGCKAPRQHRAPRGDELPAGNVFITEQKTAPAGPQLKEMGPCFQKTACLEELSGENISFLPGLRLPSLVISLESAVGSEIPDFSAAGCTDWEKQLQVLCSSGATSDRGGWGVRHSEGTCSEYTEPGFCPLASHHGKDPVRKPGSRALEPAGRDGSPLYGGAAAKMAAPSADT
nr:uncharacterized protein LOC116152530 [Camelus dromedarius]